MEIKEAEEKTGMKVNRCIFCGTSTENLLIYGFDPCSGGRAHIECLSCDCSGPTVSLASLDTNSNWLEAIIDRWNNAFSLILLKKYMEHIIGCESISYVDRLNDGSCSDVVFTKTEADLLKTISVLAGDDEI